MASKTVVNGDSDMLNGMAFEKYLELVITFTFINYTITFDHINHTTHNTQSGPGQT